MFQSVWFLGRHFDGHSDVTSACNDTTEPEKANEAQIQISIKWGTWEPGSQALWVFAGTFSEKNANNRIIEHLNRPVEYSQALLMGNLSNVPVKHIESAWQSATDTKLIYACAVQTVFWMIKFSLPVDPVKLNMHG